MRTKRLAAPRSWPIKRKGTKWITSISPGPHSAENAVPLLIMVRDMLGLADYAKEAKRIIKNGEILINGRVRKDHRFPCGFFDVVSIPGMKKNYLIIPDQKGRIKLRELGEEDAKRRIVKVVGKRMISGGRIQLTFHDGWTMLGSNDVNVGDGLVLSIPGAEVLAHYPYKEGSLAFVAGGAKCGMIGRIKEIRKIRSQKPNIVVLESNGNTFETIEKYVYVIGEREAELLK